MTSGTIGVDGSRRAEKRQLHLERVLARVRRRVLARDRHVAEDGRGVRLGHLHRPERRVERAARADGDAVERDVVRRSDQDGHVVVSAGCGTVGPGGHGARVHQPRVRRHETGHGPARHGPDAGKVPIDGRSQRVRRAGIPRPGHGGAPERL